jgi:hypothetical protein
MNILRENFLTVREKKLPRVKSSRKSLRKLVKISAQSEHFYVLVVKGLKLEGAFENKNHQRHLS